MKPIFCIKWLKSDGSSVSYLFFIYTEAFGSYQTFSRFISLIFFSGWFNSPLDCSIDLISITILDSQKIKGITVYVYQYCKIYIQMKWILHMNDAWRLFTNAIYWNKRLNGCIPKENGYPRRFIQKHQMNHAKKVELTTVTK